MEKDRVAALAGAARELLETYAKDPALFRQIMRLLTREDIETLRELATWDEPVDVKPKFPRWTSEGWRFGVVFAAFLAAATPAFAEPPTITERPDGTFEIEIEMPVPALKEAYAKGCPTAVSAPAAEYDKCLNKVTEMFKATHPGEPMRTKVMVPMQPLPSCAAALALCPRGRPCHAQVVELIKRGNASCELAE